MISWRRWQSGREQQVLKNCRYCQGRGYLDHHRCPACNRSGKAFTVYGKIRSKR